MIHFLRDTNNNTIADCESLKNDISCCIDIRHYTMFLLKLEKESDKLNFMNDIDCISEIRGGFFECNPEYLSPVAYIRKTFKHYANK